MQQLSKQDEKQLLNIEKKLKIIDEKITNGNYRHETLEYLRNQVLLLKEAKCQIIGHDFKWELHDSDSASSECYKRTCNECGHIDDNLLLGPEHYKKVKFVKKIIVIDYKKAK